MIDRLEKFEYISMIAAYNVIQAEARFHEELGSVNITAESRMFRTEDDPIETTDLFVSSS